MTDGDLKSLVTMHGNAVLVYLYLRNLYIIILFNKGHIVMFACDPNRGI